MSASSAVARRAVVLSPFLGTGILPPNRRFAWPGAHPISQGRVTPEIRAPSYRKPSRPQWSEMRLCATLPWLYWYQFATSQLPRPVATAVPRPVLPPASNAEEAKKPIPRDNGETTKTPVLKQKAADGEQKQEVAREG